jgi:Pet100
MNLGQICEEYLGFDIPCIASSAAFQLHSMFNRGVKLSYEGLAEVTLQRSTPCCAIIAMAGPNLEVFKFGLYLFFPIGMMVQFSNPEWYYRNVLPVCMTLSSLKWARICLNLNI